ncbi:MAG: hypothetical protein MJZ89_06035 [Paludibacteraceae bacterium]|nr:hypothetical protein [Paludibacteraceae bacterium]
MKFVGMIASQGLLNLQDGSWLYEATEESAYEINDPIELTTETTADHSTPSHATVREGMMVIPTQPSKDVKIQIVYDVITTDNTNPVNSSTITNTILSEDAFPLEKGVAYNFHLELGMTSVKFNATVTDWDTPEEVDVDLPNNLAYTLIGTTTSLKQLAAAKLGVAISATSFASSAVGDILIDNTNKAYECTKAAVPPAPAEYKAVSYAYIYDATNKKLYVYNGATYAENAVDDSTLSDLSEITSTTPNGYYLIGSNIYCVEQ